LVTENVLTCQNCLNRDYCSIACQKIDRKLHRHMCLRKKDACEMCGKKKNISSCSGCFQRMYCSPECQKEAWAEHKPVCNAYKAVGRDVTDPEQVVIKLSEHGNQLRNSNRFESELRVRMEVLAYCKASKLEYSIIVIATYNLSMTLLNMSRYPEAEIFAREMVAESEKLTPVGDVHVLAVQGLSRVLSYQEKFEEAHRLAHDGLERFRPFVSEGESMARLMEAEAEALANLGRYEEALALLQGCLKARTDHPERFKDGGKVPPTCFSFLGQTLKKVGRLDEAESALKKALAILKNDGIEYHPEVVIAMRTLAEVYQQQGLKKEAVVMVKAVKKLVPLVFPKDHRDYKLYMDMQ
jgi:tetratricopeptide (TPR) repeat protein